MNQKIPADPSRRIYLHGVGDVARPVDIDIVTTGFGALKSLRIYQFLPGQVIDGEAEGDEVCIVFLSGDLTMEVRGPVTESWTLRGREEVFDGPPHVVYLPPHYSYRLTPHGVCEVAYARAAAVGNRPARLIHAGTLKTIDEGGVRTTPILGPDEAEHLICSEVVAAGGAWLPFPPRQYEAGGVQLEQLSHFRFATPTGIALAQRAGTKDMLSLGEGDTLALDRGDYTVALSPAGPGYLLNFWA